LVLFKILELKLILFTKGKETYPTAIVVATHDRGVAADITCHLVASMSTRCGEGAAVGTAGRADILLLQVSYESK